jgi:uncharacterized protein YbaR (Trm112 family)
LWVTKHLSYQEENGMIKKELLDILACPACKTPVVLEEELLCCAKCGRRYPVREGIPVMLIEEGDKLKVEPQA